MPFPRRPRTAAAVLAALASAGVLAAQVLAVPPAADFTVTPGVPDVGDPVAFDSTVTDEDAGDTFSYAWDFDDGDSSTDEDPSHTYTTSGTKTVTLTVTDDPGGETTTVTRNVRVNAPPNAAFDFDPATPRPNEEVTFTSSSSDAEGGVTLAWDTDNDGAFDDGTDATEVRTYPTGGNKTVRLRATDGDGAMTVATRTVPVFNNSPPVAGFTVTPAVPDVNQAITLASNSTDPDGDATIVGWRWDLDNDGLYDERFGRSIQHSFATPGSRTVGLQVTDSSGATDDTTVTFTVNALPVPVINVLNSEAEAGQRQGVPLAGQPFEFTAAALAAQPGVAPATGCPAGPASPARPGSSDPDGVITGFAWDLENDGTYVPGGEVFASPAGGYPAGLHTVGLRVTDDDGATNATTFTFRVNAPPVPRFLMEPAAPLINTNTTFSSSSGDPDAADSTLTHSWDLDGDNVFCEAGETGATAERSYATAGTYTIRLRVTDTGGVTREAPRQLVVQNTVPTAAINVSPAAPVPGQAALFRASASSATGKAIASIEWDFEYDPMRDRFDVDASGAAVSRAFPSPGQRTVGLRVREVGGGFTIVYRTVTINSPPRAGFTVSPASLFAGDTAVLASTSGDSDGPLVAQRWDLDNDGQFDDGSGAVINRKFTTVGSFTVRLRVTDDRGATAIAARTVTVRKRPLKLLSGVLIQIRGSINGRFTRLKRLLVQSPKGTKIVVTCARKGCDERAIRRGNGRKLRVRALEGRLTAGTKIVISIAKAGYLTRRTTFVTRRGKGPLRKDLCVEPGATKGRACPAGP